MTCLEYLYNLWVEVSLRRQDSDHVTDLTEAGKIDTGVSDITVPLRVLDCVPSNILPVFSIKLKVLTLSVGLVELGFDLLIDCLKGSLRDSLIDQLLAVDVANGVHVFNDGVHERLSERRLIEFVMAHLAITN